MIRIDFKILLLILIFFPPIALSQIDNAPKQFISYKKPKSLQNYVYVYDSEGGRIFIDKKSVFKNNQYLFWAEIDEYNNRDFQFISLEDDVIFYIYGGSDTLKLREIYLKGENFQRDSIASITLYYDALKLNYWYKILSKHLDTKQPLNKLPLSKIDKELRPPDLNMFKHYARKRHYHRIEIEYQNALDAILTNNLKEIEKRNAAYIELIKKEDLSAKTQVEDTSKYPQPYDFIALDSNIEDTFSKTIFYENLLHKIEFPHDILNPNFQGYVIARILINEDGYAKRVLIIESPVKALSDAVEMAAFKSIFPIGTFEKKAVMYWMNIKIPFKRN